MLTVSRGAKTFRKSGDGLINYPQRHLANGRTKNNATNTCFKKVVRILKRVENAMYAGNIHRVVPSYFIECLVYNCPNPLLTPRTWTDTVRGVLVHIYNGLDGAEPSDTGSRWHEVNDCKWLFAPGQAWTRADGREFAAAAWNYLGYKA